MTKYAFIKGSVLQLYWYDNVHLYIDVQFNLHSTSTADNALQSVSPLQQTLQSVSTLQQKLQSLSTLQQILHTLSTGLWLGLDGTTCMLGRIELTLYYI